MNVMSIRVGLIAAAMAFIAYPVLRPYGPETGSAGAADLASPWWLAAHVAAMAGFVLVALVLRRAAAAPPWPWPQRAVRASESGMWVGTTLLLPYYGAETFGLQALGVHAQETGDPAVLAAVDGFRFAPAPLVAFSLGLVALAVVGVRITVGLWSGGGVSRWGGLLVGLGLVTFLPQFYGSPEIRMLHGLVLGLGLMLLAVSARVPGGISRAAVPGHTPDRGVGAGAPGRSSRR